MIGVGTEAAMKIEDFSILNRLAQNLYIRGEFGFKFRVGEGLLRIEQRHPWRIVLLDSLLKHSVATIEQQWVDEPPFPTVLKTVIEDETEDAWATPLLTGLLWILENYKQAEFEEDIDDDPYDDITYD